MKNFIIAPDKFKDGATASELTRSICEFLSESCPESSSEGVPISDGGEGFVKMAESIFNASSYVLEVEDPIFRTTEATIAEIDLSSLNSSSLDALSLSNLNGAEGHIAVLEMAQASGIEKLSTIERNAWKTSSIGTGQMIKAAAARGAKAIILGIGGSATNDCGMGALEALGLSAYDRTLQQIEKVTPAKFKLITTLGSTAPYLLKQFPPLRIACDVDNPLVGERGCTAVFGPQKGLTQDDIPAMDRLIGKTGRRLLGLFNIPSEEWGNSLSIEGTGAAGGIGFALMNALPDAKLVSGFTLIKEWLNWDQKIKEADILITGEGKLDSSSLNGKGPYRLLETAKHLDKVIYLTGKSDPEAEAKLRKLYPNTTVLTITPDGMPLEEALQKTIPNTLNALKKIDLI